MLVTGLRALRAPLLAWYAERGRDLPWRRTRDPYAVWVSEVMLQQTRVATVVRYWDRFLERFPTVEALAAAPEHEVLAAWSGLGYYRRACALHAGAREVVARHGGTVPAEPDTLREIPGIGRYTAGAIASIAFGREAPVLDGNVRRVLTRIAGGLDELPNETSRDKYLWELAARMARGPRPGDLNQALMELGATLCTPRAPACPDCPVAARCLAKASGEPERWPRRGERPAIVEARATVAVLARGRSVLLARRSESSPLRGDWDLPAVEIRSSTGGAAALSRALAEHGLVIELRATRIVLRHAILNRALTLEVLAGRVLRGQVAGSDALRWADPEDIPRTVPVSGATRKVLAAVGADRTAVL